MAWAVLGVVIYGLLVLIFAVDDEDSRDGTVPEASIAKRDGHSEEEIDAVSHFVTASPSPAPGDADQQQQCDYSAYRNAAEVFKDDICYPRSFLYAWPKLADDADLRATSAGLAQ